MTLPTPADLAALPPAHLPDGCLCAARSAEGCQLLQRNLARFWGQEEPRGKRCRCRCHKGKP